MTALINATDSFFPSAIILHISQQIIPALGSKNVFTPRFLYHSSSDMVPELKFNAFIASDIAPEFKFRCYIASGMVPAL